VEVALVPVVVVVNVPPPVVLRLVLVVGEVVVVKVVGLKEVVGGKEVKVEPPDVTKPEQNPSLRQNEPWGQEQSKRLPQSSSKDPQ